VAFDPPLAVLDLETTGTTPGEDRIIEIAIVRTRGLAIERTFSSLVASPSPVGRSVRIHGIEDAALVGAPALAALAATIEPLVRDATVVAHRGAFDRAFLAAACDRGELPGALLERPWLDTAALGERAFGEGGLRAIAAQIGGPLPSHRALPDALAALAALGAACDVLAPRHVDDLLALQLASATMRDDLASLLRAAQDTREPVGFWYRPRGKRARVDVLTVDSVDPPYVTGSLRDAGVRRILRGDRILRAWAGPRPSIRFLDGTPGPTASPDVGDSRS
jgi:DNA polymerase III epsilon subunit-like protein